MKKILVIDDEKPIRNTLSEILEYEDHEVELAEDGVEGIEKAKEEKFDIILCDIKMPKLDGVEVIEKLMEICPEVPVIMISGHGTVETAVETLKKGAYDFIEKPLDLNRLLVSIRNAIERKDLMIETQKLKRKVSKTYEMVGESEAIRKVKEMIDRVAPTDARVLITGNNGTGKELVARWMHEDRKSVV